MWCWVLYVLPSPAICSKMEHTESSSSLPDRSHNPGQTAGVIETPARPEKERKTWPSGPERSLSRGVPGSRPKLCAGQKEYHEPHGAHDRRDNPEAHGNLALRPAQGLEVVVEGRREKYLFLADLARRDLDDYRERL